MRSAKNSSALDWFYNDIGFRCHKNGDWDMTARNWRPREWGTAAGLATLVSSLAITSSFAESLEKCRAYADDYSNRYSTPWATSTFNVGGRRAGATALAAGQ
jgi:hypothetical protein